MVHPQHFHETLADPDLPLDPVRDDWTLPLIPQILARGLPLLAICRGAQEVNVALGGSLYQAVQDAGPFVDHRADSHQPAAVQYGPAHAMEVVEGGRLHGIVDRRRFDVNSLHSQAVKTLAPGLLAEARAPDGLSEAFCQPSAPGFNLCVQWHPEWQAADNLVSMRLLEAFGHAVRQYRDKVRGPLPG